MGPRTLSLALLALLALAGCGTATHTKPLSVHQVPLIPGASIVTQATQCDGGSDPFCAIEAVVVDHHATSSGALVASEDRRLHQLGWKSSAGDDGDEVAADSPGQVLRLTFATGLDDLIGIDEHWIIRSPAITSALDHALFTKAPSMSIMLEVGPT
jgi:hypothetical protein